MNEISLELTDNADLQTLLADKNAGDRVTLSVTVLIKEKSDERFSGVVEEVEGQSFEEEAEEEEEADEENPGVKVIKSGMTDEEE